MRHLLAASPLLCAALPLLVGCSATLDFDSVTGGSPGDGASEDGSSQDGSSQDGSSQDGEPGGDGDGNPVDVPDAGTGADFSCANFREDEIEFCDDFDGDEPTYVWSDVAVYPAGTQGSIKADSGQKLSGTRSLLSTVVGGYASTEYQASRVLKNFDNYSEVPFETTISFDVKLDSYDRKEGARIGIFQFMFGPLEDLNQLVINLKSNATSVGVLLTQNGNDGTFGSDSRQFPVDQWIHVDFWLQVNGFGEGAQNFATLYVNGNEIFNGKLSGRLNGKQPRMEIGIPAHDAYMDYATAIAWQVRHENVVVVMKAQE